MEQWRDVVMWASGQVLNTCCCPAYKLFEAEEAQKCEDIIIFFFIKNVNTNTQQHLIFLLLLLFFDTIIAL